MKAMSLHQPYASLVAHGLKIETRSARPTTRYRGPLLIHAAKKWTQEQHDKLDELTAKFQAVRDVDPIELPLGSLVAVARVVDIREMTPEWIAEQTPLQLAIGDWKPGRYGWVFDRVERLDPPIPCRGFQGLWNVRADDVGPEGWARLERLLPLEALA